MQSLPCLLKLCNVYYVFSLYLLNSYNMLWQGLFNTCGDQASMRHLLLELKFMWREADRQHLHDPGDLAPAAGFCYMEPCSSHEQGVLGPMEQLPPKAHCVHPFSRCPRWEFLPKQFQQLPSHELASFQIHLSGADNIDPVGSARPMDWLGAIGSERAGE